MNRREFVQTALATGALALKTNLSFALDDNSATSPPHEVDLSPASWPLEERQRYLTLEEEFNGIHPAASGAKGIVAGTSNPLAIHAGLVALEQGGTAADAALCTALTQVSLMFGAATSFAGVMNALYYEAASGKIHAMDACYNTVQNEKEPLTIPPLGTPSGRSVMVSGFMAGVQALSRRFGRLAFSQLFAPAIWVADNGAITNLFFVKPFGSQQQLVTRLAAGKEIFTKPDGTFYKEGEIFRQPAVAETLRIVSREGADYMYRGQWAKQLVEAVQSEGGELTLDDLAAYRVNWNEPLETSYRQYRLVSLNTPNFGGPLTLLAMNLLAAADIKQFGHYTKSAEALYWSIQISRLATLLVNRPAESFKQQFSGIDLGGDSLFKQDTAEQLWQRMQQPDWNQVMEQLRGGKVASNHSAAVLAVDSEGNVASVVHSINSIGWGSTGIFIGGVSIPDSACIQQGMVAKVGPGKALPGPANPVIVLDEGQPVLCCGAIGSGLHPVTIQNLMNVLDLGMTCKQAADTPNFMGPYYGVQLAGPAKPEMEKEVVGEGDFSEKLIARVQGLGQQIKPLPKALNRAQLGYWIGVQINRNTKEMTGGVTPELSARVEGY